MRPCRQGDQGTAFGSGDAASRSVEGRSWLAAEALGTQEKKCAARPTGSSHRLVPLNAAACLREPKDVL